MLKIITIPVTLYEQNARILIDDTSKEAVIVDPGGDVPDILGQLPNDVTLKAIWITHSHIDHVSGVGALLNEFDQGSIDVVAHAEDKINRDNFSLQSQMMQFPYSGDFNTTADVVHGDEIYCGQYQFKVLHTPGHAIGHIFFVKIDQINMKLLYVLLGMLFFEVVLVVICPEGIINNYLIVFNLSYFHCPLKRLFFQAMA